MAITGAILSRIKCRFAIQRNANMFNLKKVRFANYMGFFAKM